MCCNLNMHERSYVALELPKGLLASDASEAFGFDPIPIKHWSAKQQPGIASCIHACVRAV